MDLMDVNARYEMSPRLVRFEYISNQEQRTATISGDALEVLAGHVLSKDQCLSTYAANWAAIHKLAAEKQGAPHEVVTLFLRDVETLR